MLLLLHRSKTREHDLQVLGNISVKNRELSRTSIQLYLPTQQLDLLIRRDRKQNKSHTPLTLFDVLYPKNRVTMIKMASSSTTYQGKPLRAHPYPADVPPPRPEGQANPLPERIPPRQFPGVNSRRISSRFHVASVLGRETKRKSEDAPLPRNTTTFLYPDGIKRLQRLCSGPDGPYQCSARQRSRA